MNRRECAACGSKQVVTRWFVDCDRVRAWHSASAERLAGECLLSEGPGASMMFALCSLCAAVHASGGGGTCKRGQP